MTTEQEAMEMARKDNAEKSKKGAKDYKKQLEREKKQETYKKVSENVAKSSAATDAPLASKKDVSMATKDKDVKPIIEKAAEVDEAKMQDARNPANVDNVAQKEAKLQDENKRVGEAVTNNLEKNESSESNEDSILQSMGIDPAVKEADEIAFAKEALDNNDAISLMNITFPGVNGETPLFDFDFSPDGKATPRFTEPEIADPAIKSPRVALLLTVLSVLLSGASGGMLPPINFAKLAGTNEYWKRYNDMKKNIADMANGVELRQAEIDQAAANKENLPAYGQMKEAETGSTGLQQAKITADLQKQLTEMGLANAIDLKKLDIQSQMDLSKLLYDQDVQRYAKEIQAAEGAGIDFDKLAKYRQAVGGTTSVGRFLDYALKAAGAGATAVGAFTGMKSPPPPSDKNVKKFSSANTNMLRKHKLW